MSNSNIRQNRLRDALGRIYEHHPPYFREYLRRFKEDPTSRVFAPLAEGYRRLGRVEEAIEICREGLEHHPDFHGARVTLAKCFIDRRQYDHACQELGKVVKYAPENLLAQRLLGDVHMALKNPSEALHCYKMALILSPNDVSLAERIHKLERGEAQAEQLSEITQDNEVEAPPAPPVESGTGFSESDSQSFSGDVPPLWEVSSVHAPVPNPASSLESETPMPSDGIGVEAFLTDDSGTEDEGFKIEHVSQVFGREDSQRQQEITTETLADLYFKQGQYDRALRIFDRIAERHPSAELAKKINHCRMRLGVDAEALVRNRKIEVLKGILAAVHAK